MYIGFPVSIYEAYRILGLIYDESIPHYEDEEHYLKIIRHLKNYELNFYTSSSDQCIIGYYIDCFSAKNQDFTDIDECQSIIASRKKKFNEEIKLIGIDVRSIEFMDRYGKTQIIHNPKPIVITSDFI
jgi:hypothetical protein